MPQTIFTFLNEQMRNFYNFQYSGAPEDFDFSYEQDYFDGDIAPEQDVIRILRMLKKDKPQLFTNLQKYETNSTLINNYLKQAISYTIDNESKYSGNIDQKTAAIYGDFKKQSPSIFSSLDKKDDPRNVVNRTFSNVIKFSLGNIIVLPPLIVRILTAPRSLN